MYLRSEQSLPSGKQSFPRPVSMLVPQSRGNTSSFPVDTGVWVPSSRNRGPNARVNPLAVCLKILLRPEKNCPLVPVRHTPNIIGVISNNSLIML